MKRSLPLCLAMVIGCASQSPKLTLQEVVYVRLGPASESPAVIASGLPVSGLRMIGELSCRAAVDDEGAVKQAMHDRARTLGALAIQYDPPEPGAAGSVSVSIDNSVTIQPRPRNAFAAGMQTGSDAFAAGAASAARRREFEDSLRRVYRARIYGLIWPSSSHQPVTTPGPVP